MAGRAIWKGELKIGATKVPVKLYSAVADKTVHFHILDDRSLMRVKQHMVNPDTGDEDSEASSLMGGRKTITDPTSADIIIFQC